MAILRMYSEINDTTFEVEEGCVLHEVLLSEGFIPVDNTEAKEEQEKGIGDISGDTDIDSGKSEDLESMSKQELAELAGLLGIEVKSKDTVATLIKKIKEVKGE